MPKPILHRALAVTFAFAVASFSGATAEAQLTKDEAKCRSTIAKAYGKYVKLAGKAIAKCHANRDQGSLGGGIDCNDLVSADTTGKSSKAATKAAEQLAQKCAGTPIVLSQFGRCPTPFHTVDDGGATSGIDDTAELATCLHAHAEDQVQTRAERVLGSPTVPLTPEEAKCHTEVAKRYTKYVDAIVKARAKCQASRDKAGEPIGFDSCVLDDSSGKIQKTREKAEAKIAAACDAPPSLKTSSASAPRARVLFDELDFCVGDLAESALCAFAEADNGGTGLAAMMWELPGICPGAGLYTVSPVITDTELDAGFSGLVHDMDPILGYRALDFVVTCDPDCNSCSSSEATPAVETCRCDDDASTVCSTNADCGGTCRCYYGPPTPFAAGGTPACVVNEIVDDMTAFFDPALGELDLTLPLRVRIYLGISLLQPCPLCEAGVCNGGDRDGLACIADGSDATFGDVSYDCPPDSGKNVSGGGLKTTVEYSTGSLAIPFGVPCSAPFETFDCACAVCSTDSSIVCELDADCTAAPVTCSGATSYECANNADCSSADIGPCQTSIGRCIKQLSAVCTTNADCQGVDVGLCTNTPVCNGGSGRRPNSCDFGFSCIDDGGGEGECEFGPVDTYCDGQLRSNGEGIIPCYNNSDCDIWDSECAGTDCGNCTLGKVRECFLDPITASGSPGSSVVGMGCLGNSSNGGVNSVIGLPGAYRVRQNLGTADLKCSDGVTEFIPPGGSNCP